MLVMPSDGCTTLQTICAYPSYGEIRGLMVLFHVILLNFLAQERPASTEKNSHIFVQKA
jgi:hypothetical protein